VAEGRADEAVSHFYKAVAIYPDDPVGNLNIGIYEQTRGNFSAAIERYKKTISLTRDPELKAAAWNNMAAAYRQLGDLADAQQSQDAAAKLRR
jgi:tetratricopeptide (TPR) repeat protein